MIKSVSANKVKIVLLRRSEQEYMTEMAVKPLKLPPIQHKVSKTQQFMRCKELTFNQIVSRRHSMSCFTDLKHNA